MNRRTSRTPRTFIGLVAALGLLVALSVPAMAAPHEGNPGGNCDTTATSVKTNTSDGSIVLAEGTIFCVKASDTNSGTLVADGETTLNEYLVQEGIDHNVSNYVVYGRATATPTPTPTPTPTATPDDDDAALNIRKVDEQGNRLPGAVFTVEGMQGTFTTGANGHFCITGLPDDSVWLVTEIQAPAGYEIADPASQLVEVDDDGDCNSPDAVFVNALASTATPTPTPTPTPSEGEGGGTATPTPTPTPSERGGVEGGNPTPAPSGGELPDTAMGVASSVPATLLGLIALLSISALLYVRLAGVPARR